MPSTPRRGPRSTSMAMTDPLLALGVVGALAATRLLGTFLFDVEASDIATYGVTVVLVAAAGILAALLPAHRATRVDPAIVLRE